MASRTVTIRLPELFAHQAEFLACTKRYAIACSGTKAGKTAAGAVYAIKRLLDEPGCAGTWVAPTYGQAVGVGLEAVKSLLPAEHCEVRMSPPSLTIGGSTLHFASGDQPDNLYGPRRDFAVVDEAGRLSEEAWSAVRSTLTFTSGPARLLSNPSPRTSWFFRLFVRGLDADDPDVRSFRWRTSDNPLVPVEEIADAARNLSERTFRGLYLGEFMDIGGSVFRDVQGCASGMLKGPEPGRSYIAGLDLARLADWTVLTVVDVSTREVVSWERWHGVSWDLTVSRVAETAKRYNGAKMVVDSTGLGDPVLETLERLGVNVEGVRFSSTSKAQMVERLAGLMERRRITFPPIDLLIGELESFSGETSPNGTTRYAAPSGMTDDAVCSLMLAARSLPLEGEGLMEGSAEGQAWAEYSRKMLTAMRAEAGEGPGESYEQRRARELDEERHPKPAAPLTSHLRCPACETEADVRHGPEDRRYICQRPGCGEFIPLGEAGS